MRKLVVIVIIVACAAGAGYLAYGPDGAPAGRPGVSGGPGGGGPGGGRGGPSRSPMTVEFAPVTRTSLSEQVLLVGNLIGAATVEIVPKVSGRLQTVNVRLGDPVRRGQLIAKVEDREIQEQVRAAQAAYQVSRASIRQREADLQLAKTNLDRSRSLFERQLLPQQTYDDTQARYQAAAAQVDLANAQFEQASARLDELKITLSNTQIVSPVDGFVGKRYLDPGAFVSANAPVASLVDIRTVRMVANLVEKDVKRVPVGTPALVEVDAFPGESFSGKVSRVAPVFDPATRTAEMEIEVPNASFRLKPGMYARVQLTVGTRPSALTVPSNALVNLDGQPGVFLAAPPRAGTPQPAASATPTAVSVRFQPVEVGIRDGEQIEITSGLAAGAEVITTGAGALKDGDLVLPMVTGRRGGAARDAGQRPPGSTR